MINDEHREVEIVEIIEDEEDNKLTENKIVENDVHQLNKEIIESCELIKDQEYINEVNEYLEIIFNNPDQLL